MVIKSQPSHSPFIFPILVTGSSIFPIVEAINLGVISDSSLSLTCRIQCISSSYLFCT